MTKHFSCFLCKGNICSKHVICKVVSQHGKVMITNNSNTDSHVLWFKNYSVDEVHIIIVNTVELNVKMTVCRNVHCRLLCTFIVSIHPHSEIPFSNNYTLKVLYTLLNGFSNHHSRWMYTQLVPLTNKQNSLLIKNLLFMLRKANYVVACNKN